MRSTGRFTILVIGEVDDLTSEIKRAWAAAHIDLLGPYTADAIINGQTLSYTAAIIDVRYDAEIMLRLTQELEERGTPFLFYVSQTLARQEAGPYVLSAHPRDIRNIVSGLTAQQGGTFH